MILYTIFMLFGSMANIASQCKYDKNIRGGSGGIFSIAGQVAFCYTNVLLLVNSFVLMRTVLLCCRNASHSTVDAAFHACDGKSRCHSCITFAVAVVLLVSPEKNQEH